MIFKRIIQTNIEKGKLGKLDEYERKVGILEEKFDEAIDTSEKKFEIVDNQVRNTSRLIHTIAITNISIFK